ncbi:MAG: winged helix-turn-helix domain-containing protein [Christensenellales bacterium]
MGHGTIYAVLERHGWRKVIPRPRHPKKASQEVVEASN